MQANALLGNGEAGREAADAVNVEARPGLLGWALVVRPADVSNILRSGPSTTEDSTSAELGGFASEVILHRSDPGSAQDVGAKTRC